MPAPRFQQARLPNGLVVIGEHNPAAKSVAVGYFVNTGSRDETPEIAGVSHFLEHMMFKGTDRRSPEDINREFDELGARYNAYTSEERTVYYGAVLPEHAGRLIDLLTDMMRPALRESDFDLEKKVILEEIAMYEDRPNFRVFDLGSPRFYNGHPLGNSVLGTPATIGPLRREQMLRYFEARYAPDNLVLAVAGAYDWEAVLEQVGSLTGSWTPAGAGREHPPLRAAQGDVAVVDSKLGRTHLAFWAPGVPAQSESRYAAALLASVVGDSDGSRLYWALVDRGVADVAQLWHDAADAAGAFMGYASTAPERAAEVLGRIREVLSGAQTEPPTREEWERAQNKLATSLTLRGETPFGRLMSLGSAYLYNGEYVSIEETLERILNTPLEEGAELLAGRPFDEVFSLSLGPGGAG